MVLCVFCRESRPKSREHVFPDWVRDGLGATGRTVITKIKDGTPASSWVTTGLTWILRDRICQPCNTGWLAQMEGLVKPFLLPAMLGREIPLDPPMQRLVAAWAAKTALLLQLRAVIDRNPAALAPASSLAWLYAHRGDPEPPPGCQVWLARTDAGLGTADARVGWHVPASASGVHQGEVYVTVFSAGDLAVRVVGQVFDPDTGRSPGGEPLLWFDLPGTFLESVRALWPPANGTVWWPPLRPIPQDGLLAFARAEGAQAGRWRTFDIPRL